MKTYLAAFLHTRKRRPKLLAKLNYRIGQALTVLRVVPLPLRLLILGRPVMYVCFLWGGGWVGCERNKDFENHAKPNVEHPTSIGRPRKEPGDREKREERRRKEKKRVKEKGEGKDVNAYRQTLFHGSRLFLCGFRMGTDCHEHCILLDHGIAHSKAPERVDVGAGSTDQRGVGRMGVLGSADRDPEGTEGSRRGLDKAA